MIPLIAGATILCFSFLGFDGLSSLSEETPNAGKVIPRAIFLTALIGGIILLLFLSSYSSISLMFHVLRILMKHSQILCVLLLVHSSSQSFWFFSCVTVLASGMAAHAGSARLMYVMGRDGVFPEKVFGYVSPTWRTRHTTY